MGKYCSFRYSFHNESAIDFPQSGIQNRIRLDAHNKQDRHFYNRSDSFIPKGSDLMQIVPGEYTQRGAGVNIHPNKGK